MTMSPIPETMAAVLLTAHGGYECLEYRTDVPTPSPAAGQVLIQVGGAGVNNTDINTRIGWYSKSVTEGTNVGGSDGFDEVDNSDSSWSGAALAFPRIQGADCAGRIVAVGSGVDQARVGDRVLVRSMQPLRDDPNPVACRTIGSECDGAFAQFLVTESRDALTVHSELSDIELASLPCAYSTAEGMLHRGGVGAERVLITGASGGVGSAAIQLAKRRGAEVLAISGAEKAAAVAEIGADEVIERGADLVAAVGSGTVDAVLDLVAGSTFPDLLTTLVPGGRYITSGAIAGPLVELDVRTLYLKDLTFYGSTFQPDEVFENLVRYVGAGEIQPLVAGTYDLSEIVTAQQDFLTKRHVGKLVLVPPAVG